MEVKQDFINDLKEENLRLKEELDYEMFSAREAFRIVVESNLDAIIGIDNNCNIILLNPAGEDLFQYVEKELLNKPIDILFRDDNKAEYNSKLIQFLNDGVYEDNIINKITEINFIRRDRTYFEGETSFAIGRGKTNLYIVLTIRDISLKKKYERELMDSNAKAQTLLNTPHQSIVLIDNAGKIIDGNKRYLQSWRLGKEEIIGRNIAAFANTEDFNDILIKIKWVFTSKEIIRYETKNKTEYYDNIIYPVIDTNGNVVQAVLVIYDITDYKLEHKIPITDNKIVFSQCILSELIHEIRTPISGIIGMCNLLYQSNQNEEEKNFISTIKESSESVITLFQNFFDLFLLEKQNVPLSIKSFNFKNILNEYIVAQVKMANLDNINLEVEFAEGFPESVNSDAQRYLQILNCLIKNFIKNTNKGNITINFSTIDNQANKQIKTHIESNNFILKDETKIVLTNIINNKHLTSASLNNYFEIEFYLAKIITAMLGGEIGISSNKSNTLAIWFTIKVNFS